MNQPTARRDIILGALLSTLPAGFLDSAAAGPVNSAQTIIRPPDQLQWQPIHA